MKANSYRQCCGNIMPCVKNISRVGQVHFLFPLKLDGTNSNLKVRNLHTSGLDQTVSFFMRLRFM